MKAANKGPNPKAESYFQYVRLLNKKNKYDLNNLKQYFKEGLYRADNDWIRFKKEKDFGLLLAVINDDLEAVKRFLKEGSNPNAAEAKAEGRTVFQHATGCSNDPEIIKALLEHEMVSEKSNASNEANQGRVKLIVEDFNTAFGCRNYKTLKVLIENDKENLFAQTMQHYIPTLYTVGIWHYNFLNSIKKDINGETLTEVSKVVKQREDLAYRHLTYWGCSALVTAGCFVGFGLAPATVVVGAVAIGGFAIANSQGGGFNELKTVVSTDAQVIMGKFTAMLHTQKAQMDSTSKQM